MRAREFVREDVSAGTTSAGSIATLAMPLGAMITRQSFGKPAKYSNSYPKKKRKQNAGR